MPCQNPVRIIQVLQGLTKIGPFVNPGMPPVNRAEDNAILKESSVLANIRRMRSGDIAYGYLKAQPPFIDAVTGKSRATIFVYRDPRDMIVSHVFYATQIHTGHGMHEYYTKSLTSMEERINAAICGVDEPGSELSGVKQKYEGYMGWLEQQAVLCLRFESLILDREAALDQILDYLQTRGFTCKLPRTEAITLMKQAIIPKNSGTFRKGQPGNWREHFSPANKQLFKQMTGDLLVRLGYEKTQDW
jgi:hypothetical protein